MHLLKLSYSFMQMFELKFDFLRAISEHEHYVALNMPLDVRGNLYCILIRRLILDK